MKYRLLVILFLTVITSGCAEWFYIDRPEDAFAYKEYNKAAELYQVDFEEEQDPFVKAEIAAKIGDAYRLSNKTILAEQWYQKALSFTKDQEVFFSYGLMQKSNEKYEAAQRTFREYALSNQLERAKAKLQIKSCQLALEWKAEETNYEVINLGEINSEYSDYAPVRYGEDRLLFSSARKEGTGDDILGWTGEYHSDLFVAPVLENGRFGKVKIFNDTICSPMSEGTATFSPDLKTIYFTRCGTDLYTNDFCKIFKSNQFSDGNWSVPTEVVLFNSDSLNIGQPFLSPDGQQLFFAANSPDAIGDKDLYVSRRKNDRWMTPENLGPGINTEGYEGFPYIHSDGKLYFASDGHLGMGGLDVFSAEKIGKTWGNVMNLKHPINSAADDFAIIFEPYLTPDEIDRIETKGYFSSTRRGGQGSDDIYKFVLGIPQEIEIDSTELVSVADSLERIRQQQITKYVIDVTVYDELLEFEDDPNSRVIEKRPLSNVVVEVLGLNEESFLAERLISNKKGETSLPVEINTELKITANKPNYFTQSKIVKTGGDLKDGNTNVIAVEIVLDKIFTQQEIVIDNIYYDLDAATLRSEALPILDELAELLRDNNSLIVEIGAHTDSRGSDRYNEDLSQRRAQSVVDYLISKKIASARLVARGYGETQLLNDCFNGVDCTEDEHQINRRTTFKVVGISN